MGSCERLSVIRHNIWIMNSIEESVSTMTTEFGKTERIGNVIFRRIGMDCTEVPIYGDGSIEKQLYDGFRSDPNYGQTVNGSKFLSWAHEYYLSPIRGNLLKWFPFNPNGCILEVGARCGALTGLLCSKLRSVTALEYCNQQALVTAQRHSLNSNLTVVVGRLDDFAGTERFDYITAIGVLEHASVLYDGTNPYESFLMKLREMLAPGGVLILAIENRIGLKYICGAPEDHTGGVLDSIYGYPYPFKVQTFSKMELGELLSAAGFCNLQWYYPFPDYKLPIEVLSDESMPNEQDSIWSLFPAPARGRSRKETLSERRLGKTLARAGLFGEFANSFLVIAGTEPQREKSRCIRFIGANYARKPKYQMNTQIFVKGQKKTVIKEAETPEAKWFTQEIAEREALAQNFIKQKAQVVIGRLDGSALYYPYIDFPSLEDLIVDAIESGCTDLGKSYIDSYARFLHNLPIITCIPDRFMREFGIESKTVTKSLACLEEGLLDCIPRNIKVGKAKWYIIDNEWTYDLPLPVDYVIFRGTISLAINLQALIQSKVSKKTPVAVLSGYGRRRQYMPLAWLEILQTLEIPFNQAIAWETQFRNRVESARSRLRLRLKDNPKVLTHVEINETKTGSEISYEIRSKLKKGGGAVLGACHGLYNRSAKKNSSNGILL